MGIPAWAAVAAAPFAVDKLVVDPISSVYGLYKNIRDGQAEQNDKRVGMELLQQFAKDPNTPIDDKMLSRFTDPKAAETAITHAAGIAKGVRTQQEAQAAPVMSKFQTDYQDIAGTSNPRFFDSPENRAEMVKAGLTLPDMTQNPYVAKGLQDFALEGQRANAMSNVLARQQDGGRIDPTDLSTVALNKDDAVGYKDVAQGVNYAQDNAAKAQSLSDAAAKAAAERTGREQVAKITDFITKADTARTYGDGTPGSFMSDLTKTIRDFQVQNGATGAEANKVVEDYLKRQYDQKTKQAWDTRSKTIGSGDAVKYIDEVINPHGEIVRTESSFKPASTKISVNAHGDTGGGDDVAAWGRAIKEGRANLQDVPSRGTIRSQVVKWIEKGGGTDYAGGKAENSAYSSSLVQQQKQLGSMGSFVKNLDAQIGRVGQLGAELYTADARLLNIPIRAVRGRIAGSPNQAKYDMYLAEIESEIGKLSTGSTGSVSELSVGAQERWSKIHDKNLSIADMLELLKETKHAGELRMKSVKDQLEDTRRERRERVGGRGAQNVAPNESVKGNIAPVGLKAKLPNGSIVTSDGKGGWR